MPRWIVLTRAMNARPSLRNSRAHTVCSLSKDERIVGGLGFAGLAAFALGGSVGAFSFTGFFGGAVFGFFGGAFFGAGFFGVAFFGFFGRFGDFRAAGDFREPFFGRGRFAFPFFATKGGNPKPN